MRHAIYLITSLTLLMVGYIPASYGQKALPSDYPRLILVQLRTEESRITALTRSKQYGAAEEVKHDAEGVRMSMIADFNKGFTYCPVYYYIDSNEALIKEKHFDGILLNADESVVSTLPTVLNTDDYAIVYYGHFTSQPRSGKVVKDDGKYAADAAPGKGLVILDSKLKQISYVYALGYSSANGKKKSVPEQYVSKNYDIEYFPLATLLSKTLSAKRGKHGRIKTAANIPL